MAIESYEYSKQPMNNTSFESGAGLSLQFGPLLNPTQADRRRGLRPPARSAADFAAASGAGGPRRHQLVVSPAPTDNPLNVYGWPGFWPVFAEFQSFDPDIAPSAGATRGCSLRSAATRRRSLGAQSVGDYECGYNSLNLPQRDTQVDKVLEPAALGFAMWKQGLWVINYWQSLHDVAGNPIIGRRRRRSAAGRAAGNTVVGQYPDPTDPTGETLLDGVAGIYLGDIPLEGWQGLTMLDEMDNKSALLLTQLLTGDGATLGGFASTTDGARLRLHVAAALVAGRRSPSARSAPTPPPAGDSWKYFPQPTGVHHADGDVSRLRDLTALLGGFAELFALTDANNADVGGQAELAAPPSTAIRSPPTTSCPTARTRRTIARSANIKVALVNIDRLHFDAAHAGARRRGDASPAAPCSAAPP